MSTRRGELIVVVASLLLVASPARGEDTSVGFRLENDVIIRIPRSAQLPTAIFGDALGIAFLVNAGHFEFSIFGRGGVSSARVDTSGSMPSTSYSAFGGSIDAGFRFAFGSFERVQTSSGIKNRSGVFAFLQPAFTYLDLQTSDGNGLSLEQRLIEFGADIGVGGKITLGANSRLDISLAVVRLAVTPSNGNAATITSNPTITIGIDWLSKKVW